MEQGLQQMMEHLLSRREEAADRQEETSAQAAASTKALKEGINSHMEATINSVRSD
jgi:hypothetical protein